MKTKAKAKTVDEVYKKLCAEGQVLMEGRCVDVIIRPKSKEIEYKELSACRIDTPKADPVEERAKQRLFKELYKDKQTRMHYLEVAGPTREEIQSK